VASDFQRIAKNWLYGIMLGAQTFLGSPAQQIFQQQTTQQSPKHQSDCSEFNKVLYEDTSAPHDKLVISLLTSDETDTKAANNILEESTKGDDYVEQPVVVKHVDPNLSPEAAEKAIINLVKEHIKKYGSLNYILIDSHGSPNKIYIGNTLNHIDFMKTIEKVVETANDLGVHPKAFVTTGCDELALNSEYAKSYQYLATSLKIHIIGSTSTFMAAGPNSAIGDIWDIGPGGVKEDQLRDVGLALVSYDAHNQKVLDGKNKSSVRIDDIFDMYKNEAGIYQLAHGHKLSFQDWAKTSNLHFDLNKYLQEYGKNNDSKKTVEVFEILKGSQDKALTFNLSEFNKWCKDNHIGKQHTDNKTTIALNDSHLASPSTSPNAKNQGTPGAQQRSGSMLKG